MKAIKRSMTLLSKFKGVPLDWTRYRIGCGLNHLISNSSMELGYWWNSLLICRWCIYWEVANSFFVQRTFHPINNIGFSVCNIPMVVAEKLGVCLLIKMLSYQVEFRSLLFSAFSGWDQGRKVEGSTESTDCVPFSSIILFGWLIDATLQ